MLHLAGHAHALLINFEQELTNQFGADRSLAMRLRIPLFVGTFTPQGEKALRSFRKTLPAHLQGFLTDYESGLDDDVRSDPRFEFRLRFALEQSPKDPDAVAIQFTRLDDMTEDERAAVEELGREGRVVVRDRKQAVSGLGRLMPMAAARQVQAEVPFVFNQHHFTEAWRKTKARPGADDPNPHRTNPDFCEYDEPTKTYRSAQGFVNYLIKKCSAEEGFEEITGKTPRLKPAPEKAKNPQPARRPRRVHT